MYDLILKGKILPKKVKYQGDYEDYYDAVHENYDATKEVELTNIPKFITNAKSIMVNEGDTIKLSCVVDKLGRFQIMHEGEDFMNHNLQIISLSCGRRVIRSLPLMINYLNPTKMTEQSLRK